jgi:alkaline phosphatase
MELDWLQNDLASTSTPAIVFVHQQLDGEGNHYIKNAAQVRHLLQESQKILAVFQGHYHPGQYSTIEGIHYYTLKAMVEGSGAENTSYAIVEVYDNKSIIVTGYGKALSKEMGQA